MVVVLQTEGKMSTPRKKYQVVALYDDHAVLMESDASDRDFAKRKIIKF